MEWLADLTIAAAVALLYFSTLIALAPFAPNREASDVQSGAAVVGGIIVFALALVVMLG